MTMIYGPCDGCGKETTKDVKRVTRWWPWSKYEVSCVCGYTEVVDTETFSIMLDLSDDLSDLRGTEMLEQHFAAMWRWEQEHKGHDITDEECRTCSKALGLDMPDRKERKET